MKKSQFFERTDKIALFLLVVCLGFRDIYPSIGKDVYVFLALIFAIPVTLLIRDLLCKRLTTKYFVGVLSVVLFYILIIPINGNGAKYFLPLFIAGVAFRYTDYVYISKSFFIMQMFILIIRLILANNGIIVSDYLYTEKIDSGISYDLGYGNPNALGCVVFFLCCYLFLSRMNKCISFVAILMISLITFDYTACRTSFFLSILLLLIYVMPFNLKEKIFYKNIILYLIPFMSLILLLFSWYLLDNYEVIDLLLSGRLKYMGQLYEMFDSLLMFFTGVPIDLGDLEFAVDNTIAYMLLCGGVCFIVIFLFQYISIVKMKIYIPLNVMIVLVLIVLSGFTEAVMAKFGFAGASFTWIFLFNKSYIVKNEEMIILS